jgi:G:T-mismatch repair DNA endonuclease (very short patch repair protein)
MEIAKNVVRDIRPEQRIEEGGLKGFIVLSWVAYCVASVSFVQRGMS